MLVYMDISAQRHISPVLLFEAWDISLSFLPLCMGSVGSWPLVIDKLCDLLVELNGESRNPEP